MILRKLNLAPRSTVSFGSLLIIIVAIGLISLKQASALSDSEKFVEENVVPSITLLASIKYEINSIRSNNNRMLVPSDAENKPKWVSNIEKSKTLLYSQLKQLEQFIVTPGGKKMLPELKSNIDDYIKIDQKYLSLLASEKNNEAIELRSNAMGPAANLLDNTLDKLISLNEEKATKAGDVADQTYADTKLIIELGITAALLITVFVAAMFTRSLIYPISESLKIAERIANNNLSHEIRLEGTDEAARLIRALALMQSNLRSALMTIGDSSTQLAATSEEMHAVTEGAALIILRQGDEIEMAATAVNEMTAAVEEVASNAASTSALTSQSSSTALSGRAQVDATVAEINQMVTNVQTTSAEVQELANMATDISKVLDVIRSIAEQTNLLALNAAIEAARAGEAGRGFAVVADEVRALAHRTQQSTQEIESMVTSIQSGTTNAVSAMKNSSVQAEKTLNMAHESGRVLGEITDALNKINDRNIMIATASEEQAQVAREVDKNLVRIRDLSSETSEGSQQTTIATQELTTLAHDLNRLIKQFQM